MPLSDLYDDLDAFLSEEPAEGEPESTPLLLEGQESADRALRRLARLDRERERVLQVAQAERARIDAWEEDRCHGLDNRRRWITDGLEGFMRALYAQTKRTSLSLPWGRLALRKGSTSVAVLETKAADTLPEHLRRTKYEVDKTAVRTLVPGPVIDRLAEPGSEYRQVLTADGEVVPGIAFLVPTERSFTATPNREGEE